MYEEYLNQLQLSLSVLTSDQLKDLLNDDEKLDDKVDEVLDLLQAQKASVLLENRATAERNIEKEPILIELRSNITQLQEECKELCSNVREKLNEFKEKTADNNSDTVLAVLETAAVESEELSDNLFEKFNNSEIQVDAFLEEFLTSRKVMHMRKLKAEKMKELLRAQQQQQRNSYGGIGGGGGQIPTYGNLPPRSRAPYPTSGMMAMPMPPPKPY